MMEAKCSPEAASLLWFANQIIATKTLFSWWDESHATLHAVKKISATEMIIFHQLEQATSHVFIGCWDTLAQSQLLGSRFLEDHYSFDSERTNVFFKGSGGIQI